VAFIADHGVQHAFHLFERTVQGPIGTAGRVADGALKVAVVGDLDQSEAGVLLVVRAEAAVVRTIPADGHVVVPGHLGGLDENFAATPVIIDIVRHEDALGSMDRAALEQVTLPSSNTILPSARRKHVEQMEIAVS
jgi:hypothetical protein